MSERVFDFPIFEVATTSNLIIEIKWVRRLDHILVHLMNYANELFTPSADCSARLTWSHSPILANFARQKISESCLEQF